MKKVLLILSILGLAACSTNIEKESGGLKEFAADPNMVLVGGLFKNKEILDDGSVIALSVIEERTRCQDSELVGLDNVKIGVDNCKSIVLMKITNKVKNPIYCNITTNLRAIVLNEKVNGSYSRDLILKQGESLKDIEVVCKMEKAQ